jgi:LysM repeat protein
MLSLMIVLVLAVGCYRPAAPDVTATPGAEAEAAETEEGEVEEGEPDLEATAIANATLAAQTPEGETEEEEEEEPTEAPTATATLPVETPTTEPVTPTEVAPSATPEPPEPTEPSAPSEQVTHVVQPGENLFRIALRYNTSVQAIASANGIANPTRIYVGQTLVIPSGTEPVEPVDGEMTYVVRPGDNLFRIALRYNMSYLYLARYNNIANPSNIRVGQVIRIPPR